MCECCASECLLSCSYYRAGLSRRLSPSSSITIVCSRKRWRPDNGLSGRGRGQTEQGLWEDQLKIKVTDSERNTRRHKHCILFYSYYCTIVEACYADVSYSILAPSCSLRIVSRSPRPSPCMFPHYPIHPYPSVPRTTPLLPYVAQCRSWVSVRVDLPERYVWL